MLKSCSVAVWLAVVAHLARAALPSESTVSSGKLLSAPAAPSSPSLGGLYRSARDDYNARRHCANCSPAGYERDMRTYGRPGVVGYYSGMGPIEDDRNWYYRPEAFDDRVRGSGGYQQPYSAGYRQPGYMMGYEYDRYMQRPDDRAYGYGYPGTAMMGAGYYDGGNSRMNQYPEMMRGYGYRGNGYDNLDPHYDYYQTQRGGGGVAGMGNRDRYYDDRMSYGGQYDQKNFRPWDQTYSGISGFDNSGRGYYFASRPSGSPPQSSPPPSSPSYSAHASHQVQAHPAASGPPSVYGNRGGSGAHEAHHGDGGYRAEYQHPGGPDRHDYQSPSDSSPSNCCRNRYPEPDSHRPAAGDGGAYRGHGPTGPTAGGYGGGGGGNGGAQKPSSQAGTWSYVSSGPIGGSGSSSSGSAGGSNSPAGGSYGGQSGPGHYSAGSGAASHESYGGNRGADHHRETDNRHQRYVQIEALIDRLKIKLTRHSAYGPPINGPQVPMPGPRTGIVQAPPFQDDRAPYGGRPRPSASLGDTSYLMDRGSGDSNRSEAAVPAHEANDADDDTRAKQSTAAQKAYDDAHSDASAAHGSEASAKTNERDD